MKIFYNIGDSIVYMDREERVQNVGRGREAMRETEGEPLVKPHHPSHRVIGDRKTPNGSPSPALILPIHASQAVAGQSC